MDPQVAIEVSKLHAIDGDMHILPDPGIVISVVSSLVRWLINLSEKSWKRKACSIAN